MAFNFRRILHPVGHNAFFTKQIIDKELQRILLSVVFDCGNITPLLFGNKQYNNLKN